MRYCFTAFNKSSSTEISEDDINQHINNEALYVIDKYATLNDDKKSVLVVKEFETEALYKEWKEKAGRWNEELQKQECGSIHSSFQQV